MSESEIRAVDPYDDAEMDAFQQVYADAELAEDPMVRLYSREDSVGMLTASGGSQLFEGYAAWDGDTMVGEALVTGSNRANRELANLWVWVRPEHQGRGIGSRLVAFGEARIAELGRPVVRAQTRIGANRQGSRRRFAERHGYALSDVTVERVLRLPVDEARLARLEAEAAPHHAAYGIRSAAGPVPEDLLESYTALKNQILVEMPHGDLEVEAGADTVDDVRRQDRELADAGRLRLGAYAVEDGRVVAYAVAVASRDGFPHVDQWGTQVARAHRGHRLGMAVKCAQVRLVQQTCPDKTYLATSNSAANAPMVAINEALGFRVQAVLGDLTKRLA